MVGKATVIKSPSGLHLCPAGVLCREALCYKPKISFKVRTTMANAKSVLSVLRTCVKSGDEIKLVCEGPDEEEVLEAMVGIVGARLSE